MRPLWAALFTALLLWVPVALVHGSVPAPENIRVRCGDERPVVSWDYSSEQPTNFTIFYLGNKNSSFSTSDREVDLSRFVWDSSGHVFDFHYVTVRAEQGQNRSEPQESPSFSYNKYKTVHVTCSLKFPPVQLTIEGAEATLSFKNPVHFYKELKTIKHSAKFRLTISIDKRSEQDRWCEQKSECKLSVDLPEDAEPCVNLTGTISYGFAREQIQVQHIGPVCAAATTNMYWAVGITFVIIFIIVVLLLTLAVCKSRAWVISTPQTLLSWKHSPSKAVNPPSHRPSTLQPETVYSPVSITGTRPKCIEDPESETPQSEQVQDDEVQVPILPTNPYEDQYESADSTKTETLSIHSSSSENEDSNYMRREEVVEMDMSGDIVKGYTS